LNREIFRYLVAGGIAFTCDFAVLYLCTEFLSIHYLLSNVLGYGVGLAIAYRLNVRWVFNYRRYKKTSVEFTIFNLIVIAGLGLSEGLMYLLADIFAVHYLAAKIFASALVMVFNYISKKFILFHPSPARAEP
jgi:putative flippase GtrA